MDEAQVRAILEHLDCSTSIEDLLQNSINKASILHAAIALPGVNKRRIVKALIEAGADCEYCDEDGLTAYECALTVQGDRELATEMIGAELKNLPDDRRAVYVMIRRGSLAVFKLFLEQTKFEEGKLFELLANAMVELNVKRVIIESKLEVFLQHHLADYAFRKLSGDKKGGKDMNEWRIHFTVIADSWNSLKARYNDRDYANIDNEFVDRIQTIHNHLYFVKDKRFLRHLPTMETVFCLAIFLAICKWPGEYSIFKLMINKLNVMQFLGVVCSQLVQIELHLDKFAEQLKDTLDQCTEKDKIPTKEHLLNCWSNANPSRQLGENIVNKIISGCKKKLSIQTITADIVANESIEIPTKINRRDRSTLARLGRCYFRTKQLYSIQKCVFHQQALSGCTQKVQPYRVTVPAVKRTIQVIGEAIKSTKNSPNIPKKMEAILAQMLTDLFPTANKYFREFFSHKYSLAKRFLFGPSESLYYNAIVSQLGHVEMIFSLLFVCSVLEACRSLLGSMRRCQSIGQLRSLLQFIGDLNMAKLAQTQQFGKVEVMFKKMSETISNSQGYRRSVDYLKEALNMKEMVLTPLRDALISKWVVSFEDIKLAALGGAEMITIHRMIQWNLNIFGQREIYENIQRYWLPNHVIFAFLEVHDTDLMNHNPSVTSGVLATIENKLRLIEEEEYPVITGKILEDLGVTDLSQEQADVLHKQLLKYYENIFFLDNKYKVIKQFFKSRKLCLDEECLKRMRIHDEQSLQKVYDDIVNDIRKMLNTAGVFSVDDLAGKLQQIPKHIILALEYCQLELNEMLITVGYSGDNFHLLKHRIPLIHGRNYRNYLAHDSLSYNVLTDSSRIKVIVNAFVLMNCSVNLFGKNAANAVQDFTFASFNQITEWSMNQKCLASGIRGMECNEIRKCIAGGADMLGIYCGEIGIYEPFKFDMLSVELVDLNFPEDVVNKVMRIFEGVLPKSAQLIGNPSYRSWYASKSGEFDKAFLIFSEHQPVINLALPQQFFYWKDLVKRLSFEVLKSDEKDQSGRTILSRFTLAGNYLGVKKVLDLNPEVDVGIALGYAIRYGFSQIAKLLLSKIPKITDDNQQMAVINHLNEFLPQLFADFNEVLLSNEIYTMTAIRVNNDFALEFLIDRLYRDTHTDLKYKHLPNMLSLAAYVNNFRIVQFLLSIPNVDYFTEEAAASGHSALQHLIRQQNWTAAKLLLDRGASPDWINPNRYQTLKTALQMAVAANSCQLLRLMPHVNRKLYRALEHPLSIAIRNDSTKMIRFLQKLGFTLLDSDGILQSSVKYGNMKFVNEIFRALDESVVIWKPSDGLLDTVAQLLSRWKAIAYLEKPEYGSFTVAMLAVEMDDCKMLSTLINKSKDIRELNERFISGVEFHSKDRPICAYGSEDAIDSSKLFACCDVLLGRLKVYMDGSASLPKIYLPVSSNSKGLHFDCYLVRYEEGNPIDLDLIPISSIKLPTIFKPMMELLKDPKDFIFGTVQTASSDSASYFVIFSDISCLFQLTITEPPQSLKLLVNSGDNVGETPLHLVANQKGDLESMNILLANGANPLKANSTNQTPLHLALIGQNCPKAMLLLNHCIEHDLKSLDGTSALELPNGQGLRPIHIAAMMGKLDAVQLLLQQAVDVRAVDSIGFHASSYALCSGYPKVLKLLLEHDPGLVHLADARGKTVLHYSTQRHDEDGILLLLEYDVDLAVRDFEGNSAIQMAFEKANTAWLKIVLFYARVNGKHGLLDHLNEQGVPVLAFSVFHNRADLIQAAVEYEIDSELDAELSGENLRKLSEILTARTSNEGYTALHIAARFGFLESAECILQCQTRYNELSERKMNLALDFIDLQGNNPLDYALAIQNEPLVSMLLSSQ